MVDMDSDTNSAEYDTIKDYCMHMHTEPAQVYYVTHQQASGGAVKSDKEKECVHYQIQEKVKCSSVDYTNHCATCKHLGFIDWGFS